MNIDITHPLNKDVLYYLGRDEMAIGNGTQYNLRLTTPDFQEAIAKGAKTKTRWSTGEEMDSAGILGPGWIFGGWFKEEVAWCLNTYNAFETC